jgi:hypothetical protein
VGVMFEETHGQLAEGLPTSSSETNVATSSQVVTDFYSNHRVVAGSCTVDLSSETARWHDWVLGLRFLTSHNFRAQLD